MEVKNELVQRALDWLEETRPIYNKKRLGQAWRSILEAVAVAFPEDRAALIQKLAGESKSRRRNIPVGGAKVTRGTGGKAIKTVKTCKDCPDSATVQVEQVQVRTIRVGEEPEAVKPAPVEPEIAKSDTNDQAKNEFSFTSADDVLDRFDGDAIMMIDFAKKEGIKIGQAISPKTLSKRIFKHYSGK